MRKKPVYGDSNSRPNVSEGYEVTSELPGRAVGCKYRADLHPNNADGVSNRSIYQGNKN